MHQGEQVRRFSYLGNGSLPDAELHAVAFSTRQHFVTGCIVSNTYACCGLPPWAKKPGLWGSKCQRVRLCRTRALLFRGGWRTANRVPLSMVHGHCCNGRDLCTDDAGRGLAACPVCGSKRARAGGGRQSQQQEEGAGSHVQVGSSCVQTRVRAADNGNKRGQAGSRMREGKLHVQCAYLGDGRLRDSATHTNSTVTLQHLLRLPHAP